MLRVARLCGRASEINITRRADSVKAMKSGAAAALLVFAVTSPAFATPNMIRLGYPSCASCHISPQGGGLLTDYGKGIDAAQTLRPEEIADGGSSESRRAIQVPYDAKFSLGVDRSPSASTGYSFGSSVRTAV